KSADYAPVGDLKGLLAILAARYEARVKKDRDFQDLQEDIGEFKLQRRKNLLSLNETVRRNERDAQEARLKLRESRTATDKGSTGNVIDKEVKPANGSARRDDGLQADERNLANELAAEKVRKNAKDILLNEAVHILGDQVGILKTGTSLAGQKRAGPQLLPN
ncbi:MAG: tail-specific protease, partial [Bradyrhizobium sp.]|nr:tail-specific protease [Bradyrhizobium sp.]